MFLVGKTETGTTIPNLPAKETLYMDTLVGITAERSAKITSMVPQPSKPETKGTMESANKKRKTTTKQSLKDVQVEIGIKTTLLTLHLPKHSLFLSNCNLPLYVLVATAKQKQKGPVCLILWC